MHDPGKLLSYALERYPDRVAALPAAELVIDSGRKNDRRPAYLKLAVPDEWVKNLRGGADRRDLVFLVQVPREVLERSESRIVLPGEIET